MEYIGTIKTIRSTQQVSDKFRKREFVVTDNATSYPQTIQFEMTQDRVDALDNVKVGDEIKIQFALKGREWANKEGEVKVFNTLQAFSILKLGDAKFQGEKLVPTPDDGLPF